MGYTRRRLELTGTTVSTPRPSRVAVAFAASLLTMTAGRRLLLPKPRTDRGRRARSAPAHRKPSPMALLPGLSVAVSLPIGPWRRRSCRAAPLTRNALIATCIAAERDRARGLPGTTHPAPGLAVLALLRSASAASYQLSGLFIPRHRSARARTRPPWSISTRTASGKPRAQATGVLHAAAGTINLTGER